MHAHVIPRFAVREKIGDEMWMNRVVDVVA
jgi:hypothetical protein